MHKSAINASATVPYLDRQVYTLFVISARLRHQLCNVLLQVINAMSHVI